MLRMLIEHVELTVSINRITGEIILLQSVFGNVPECPTYSPILIPKHANFTVQEACLLIMRQGSACKLQNALILG